MSRRLSLFLGIVAASAAIAALVWIRIPGEAGVVVGEAGVGEGEESRSGSLGLSFSPTTVLNSCNGCHFQWETPFHLNATRDDAENGTPTHSLQVSPQAGYDLAAVLAAPRRADDGVPAPALSEQWVRVPGNGNGVAVTFAPPWAASAVMVEVGAAESDDRPDIEVLLQKGGEGSGAVQGQGSRARKFALLKASEGAALEGEFEALVVTREPMDVGTEVGVRFWAFPAAYSVVDGVGFGTQAEFNWALPPPGEPGAPERFHVAVVPFNEHPTDRWMITNNADFAYYEGDVALLETAPAPANWTEEDLEAIWGGKESMLLHQEEFEGVLLLKRSERGEWIRHHVNTKADSEISIFTTRPPSAPFPPMPPGTTHVMATLTWQKNAPLSPDPSWQFAVTQRPKPDFRYPDPVSLKPGERVDVVPIDPDEWETTETGWFQGHYLLELDDEGKATFEGDYQVRFEAFRGPLPPSVVP